ncbi:MAG: hypothetical protein NXI22_01305 [bacterium]|nr:hypothetical protein [bacterium]
MSGQSRLTAVFCLAISAMAFVGCRPDTPLQYQVRGVVTFEGKPVPKGFVKFLPDVAAGNRGPGGGAEIINGNYQTEYGKGVQGGAYRVAITGLTGEPVSMNGEELPDGVSLFPPYLTKVEFPNEDVEQNFEIPAE